jgi:hypothetical protein
MSAKKPTTTPTTVAADDSGDRKARLRNLGGSRSDHWNNILVNQATQSAWLRELIAAHNAAMECYGRAMIGEQTFEGRRENLNQANKLSRSYAVLLEALNRHRGKGQQKVTVEHVHVYAGGQAVVGVVDTPERRGPGGGDGNKTRDQPHAKQVAHAPEPALPCPNQARDAVPIACDGERALPDARREGSGRTEGK